MSSLRKKSKELEISAKKRSKADFDPEDDDPFSKPADSESDEVADSDASADEELGREHYETVGKSRLRGPEKSNLDEKKYGGQAVSRRNLFQDDGTNAHALDEDEDQDEDPFALKDAHASGSEGKGTDNEDEILSDEDLDMEAGQDEEIESDEAFENGEEEKFRSKGFVFRGSGQGLTSLPAGNDEESDKESRQGSDESLEEDSDLESDEMDGMELDDEDDGADEPDEDEDEETVHPRPLTLRNPATSDREKLKSLIANDTAALASALSASRSADAKKGIAVKQQYQTFDRLLDARIKLQKGLTASDNLSDQLVTPGDEAQAALQKAEDAALRLYSTIESLRHTILQDHTGKDSSNNSRKRKRPAPPDSSTPSSDLWTRLSTLEAQSLPLRRQTLDKWSTKTRAAGPVTSSSTSSKLTDNSTSARLTSVLDTYLLSTSTTTTQPPPPPSSYTSSDSPFYQSLLRDLIASRTRSTAPSSSSATLLLPTKLHPTAPHGPRKSVDTKASKGRKIRYTVHEKLENFMAGRGDGFVGQWNDAATWEFFASLLGQRGVLLEGGEEEEDGKRRPGGTGEGKEEDGEGEALRLFRT